MEKWTTPAQEPAMVEPIAVILETSHGGHGKVPGLDFDWLVVTGTWLDYFSTCILGM